MKDCPGHDRCYPIDATKLEQELGWKPAETWIWETVQWYLDHPGWVEDVTSGAYWQWLDKQYGEKQLP